MELTTARLVLREYRADDVATTHAYGGDPDVTRHTIFGPNSEDETRQFLNRMLAAQTERPRTSFELAVELKDGKRHIGGIGLRVRGEQAELGYVFGKTDWGRGYASEAATALVGFGFADLKLHRIYALCDADNPASARVMRKIGMRHEGTFLKAGLMKGQWRDELRYAILAEEWQR